MKELHDWFEKNRREFPWRKERTPYKVWISEVMLQQTRASVVIPYFERWLQLFPNVSALASAKLETVIKAWEGLGYYSRARNLHAAAKEIVTKFQGEIPSSFAELQAIRGLGPYTTGAILSFGFQKRAAAVDGNVTRVLSRYYLIEENICRSPVKKKIQGLAENILHENEPWITSEALIELGALICTVKPRCEACPLQKTCLANAQNKTQTLPIKNEEKPTIELSRAVAIIDFEGHLLLKKGEAGRVMADLYEFPYFEMGAERWSQKKIVKAVDNVLQLKVEFLESLPEERHTFTRYKAVLYPIRLRSLEMGKVESCIWVPIGRLRELPFSSGHRRILKNIE